MTSDREHVEQFLAEQPARSLRSTLFNIAHAYARSADNNWATLESTQDPDFAAPAIMCQSFAVELLLKFFLAIDHPTAKTIDELKNAGAQLRCHKYSELFDQLTQSTKDKIAGAFSRLSGKATNAAAFRKALVAQGDDPFVYWRYIYEEGLSHFDRVAFNLITDALGKAAEVERKASPNA
jgi:phospholipase/lecithinase/hemolysin